MYQHNPNESNNELVLLKKDLAEEQEKVQRLTAQLSTNVRFRPNILYIPRNKSYRRDAISLQSHVVSAFEHSLSNMTNRLAKLNKETEKKVLLKMLPNKAS